MATTPRQLIDQATRHSIHLERLKSGEVKKFERFLKNIDKEIRLAISGKRITEFTRPQLERQLAQITAAMNAELSDFRQVWRQGLLDLSAYEAQFEIRSLEQVTAKYSFTLPTEQQITTAVFSSPLSAAGPAGGLLLDTFYDKWTEQMTQRVEGAIRLGYAQGQTTQDILSNLRGQVTRGYRDGELAKINREMGIVVRTGLQHAASQAKRVTWENNSDIIKRYRWLSTIDSKTSQQCMSLDSMEFKVGQGPLPPAHPNCRSSTVAVLDDRFAILDEGGTRAARDPDSGKIESVPAKQTYYGWLKNQPAEFQDSVIGPTRGKLLRNGGLTAQRFQELSLDKNFQPTTLAEMKRMEPLAFSKANID